MEQKRFNALDYVNTRMDAHECHLFQDRTSRHRGLGAGGRAEAALNLIDLTPTRDIGTGNDSGLAWRIRLPIKPNTSSVSQMVSAKVLGINMQCNYEAPECDE